MFGGFIEYQGRLESVSRKGDLSELRLSFTNQNFSEKLCIGRSIAVNGVCLTVTAFSSNAFTVECSRETMNKSALGNIDMNASVNLEFPITLNTLLDGHIVSGHIDAVGKLKKTSQFSGNIEMTFLFEPEFRKFLVEKGSVSINGISLTAFNVTANAFTVSVIPHTFEKTNLKHLKEQSQVNLEFDLIGKYVLNMGKKKSEGVSVESLAKHGFL